MFHRRSIRLSHYDYSQKGAYFITICTQTRVSLFNTENAKNIVSKWWIQLETAYHDIVLDEYVVMPNHFHGIVFLVGAIHELPYCSTNGTSTRAVREPPLRNRRNMTIPKIIGYSKMNSAKNINRYLKTSGKQVWQRNYYERIIRNEIELQRIRKYIRENPLRHD